MLETIFEFAIALTGAPLVFCWVVDLRNVIVYGRRRAVEPVKPATEAKSTKPAIQAPRASDPEKEKVATKAQTKSPIRYTSKPIAHRVKEGYPDYLTLKDQVVTYKLPTDYPLETHLQALGLSGKQLNELKAAELRKLGTRMGIANAARGRKKDLLKVMRGKHGYA